MSAKRAEMALAASQDGKIGKDWASTAGTGGRQGAWGISGRLGQLIAYTGVIALILLCPCIAIFMYAVPHAKFFTKNLQESLAEYCSHDQVCQLLLMHEIKDA